MIILKAHELKEYGEYVLNFKNALNTLQRVQDNDPKFRNFVDQVINIYLSISTLHSSSYLSSPYQLLILRFSLNNNNNTNDRR